MSDCRNIGHMERSGTERCAFCDYPVCAECGLCQVPDCPMFGYPAEPET